MLFFWSAEKTLGAVVLLKVVKGPTAVVGTTTAACDEHVGAGFLLLAGGGWLERFCEVAAPAAVEDNVAGRGVDFVVSTEEDDRVVDRVEVGLVWLALLLPPVNMEYAPLLLLAQ